MSKGFIYKILFLLPFILGIFFFNPQDSYAQTCGSWQGPTSTSPQYCYRSCEDCLAGCFTSVRQECAQFCTSCSTFVFPCGPANCFSRGWSCNASYYWDYSTDLSLCTSTPPPPPCSFSCGACTAGTYYATQPANTYISGSRSCTCPTTTQNCYSTCEGCTPTCSAGYSTTQPSGSYITEEVSCSDSCRSYSQTCYRSCPNATCSTLNTSDLTFHDTCPSANPDDCESITTDVPISSPPSGCPTEQELTCYIENSPAQLDSLVIVPGNHKDILSYSPSIRDIPVISRLIGTTHAQTVEETSFGFSTITHSGLILNNPILIDSTFVDNDGAQDIKAMTIWWTTGVNHPNVPTTIGTGTGQSQNNRTWGIMLRRTITGWQMYTPRYTDPTITWTAVDGCIGTSISNCPINNAAQATIINAYIDINESGNEINVQTYLDFSDVNKAGHTFDWGPLHPVYNVWAKANDTFNFLPFGGTTIRDMTLNDSGQDWSVDLTNPSVSLSLESATETTINLSYSASDNHSYLRYVNIYGCRSDPRGENTPINGVVLDSCNDFNFEQVDVTSTPNLLALSLGTASTSGSLPVDIEGSEGGSITFYILGIDSAGNYATSSFTYHLGEWAVTKRGFVFGQGGVSSMTRDINDASWASTPVPYSFVGSSADLSDILLVKSTDYPTSLLGLLLRYGTNSSFKSGNFPGVSISNPFEELSLAYENKKQEGKIQEVDVSGTISGNISDYCTLGESSVLGLSTVENLYNIDFETNDFSQLLGPNVSPVSGGGFEGSWGGYFGKGVYWDVSLVDTPAIGTKSAALTIGSGDTTAAYLFTYLSPSTGIGIYEADFYVPSTITPSDWWNVWQWKSINNTYNKPIIDLNLIRSGGILQLVMSYVPGGISTNPTQTIRQTVPIPFPTNTFVNIKGIYTAKQDNTGSVEIYQDDQLIFQMEGFQTQPSPDRVLWSINHYADSISPNPATIYIDNMMVTTVEYTEDDPEDPPPPPEESDPEDPSDPTPTEICGLEADGNLTISAGFQCDEDSLIIASGDINITPDFLSDSDKSCILFAGGNINILSGGKPSFTYDQIQGFLIAQGQIDILSDTNRNGLAVEGGLTAFTPLSNSSIINSRTLSIGNRNIYPVLAVSGNSKYGILARKVFGSQIDVFKLEVGFKPY